MSKEYYRKRIIDLRASLEKEREAKKKDNAYYADLVKRATSPSSKASYRKSKVDRAASHDRRIESLNTEKSSLSEKVAIAAQLDAVGISMSLNDKKGKSTKKIEKAKNLQVNFSIAKNVTASNGVKTLYVRIQTPNGQVLTNGGTFDFENRSLQYSMKKQVEYTGNETPVSMFWNISEFLSEGTYKVSIFADGHMIGSRSFTF